MLLDARRSSPGLSRRAAVSGVGAAALSFGSLQRAGAQDATPAEGSAHPIVGAWRIIPDPPGPPLVLILYHADGTVLFSTPSGSPAEPGASHAVTFDTASGRARESAVQRCRPPSLTSTSRAPFLGR